MSKKRWFSVAAVVLAGTAIPLVGRTSDHIDSPAGTKDPTADIADFFAFTSPEKGGRLVLIMDVHPSAFKDAKFNNKLTYSFRVRPDSLDDKRELRIDCNFDGEETQYVTCAAYAFDAETRELTYKAETAAIPVDKAASDKSGMRVFAGLRADPFYLDAASIKPSMIASEWKFTGANALNKLDVLGLAVEIDAAKLLPQKGTQVVRGAAEISMRVTK